MIGYAIDGNYHRNGYATEALAALKNWAFGSSKVLKITAYTPINNIASQKVLNNNDFQNVGEVIEDGIACYIWELKKIMT